MSLQTAFTITVALYSATNLAAMGLELSPRATIKSLRSARLVALTLAWGWVVGPAFALLLTKVLPMAEPYAMGLLLLSLAPVAPFFPLLVGAARADMDFAAALMPLAMVATVLLLPLLAPLLIPGLSVNTWALAKPLLLLVLLPLIVGAVIRIGDARTAERILPVAKRLAGVCTLMMMSFIMVRYFREFVSALGSYAIGSQIIFSLAITLASYGLAFGLQAKQRSAMALGMCSRNAGAMFAAYTAFPSPDPRLLVMILLAGPVPGIMAVVLAKLFASRAGKTAEAGVA